MVFGRIHALAASLLLFSGAASATDTQIRLASGETLKVTIVELTETHLRCTHEVLGEILIPRDQVVIVAPAEVEAAAAQGVATAAETAAEQPQPAEAAPPVDPATPAEDASLSFWRGWKHAVDLGLLGSDGNSETFGARAGFGAERKAERMETTIGLSYVYSTDDGEKTKSRGEATARNDWLFGKDSRWGFFVEGKIEYDEFQDWDWRLSGFLGPSYAFIKNERTLLRGRVGIGGSYEIGGDEQEFEPELLLGLDYEHAFNERNKIFATAEYLPSLSDFPQYRVNSKAGWEILVDEKSGANLKLGVVDRYDSSPGDGFKRNDIEYFVTLGWTF